MRILFYSPDSYGLGHVRRTIAIADRLCNDYPDASALVLTGAPRAHYFGYPPRCDYVKLPSVTKDTDGAYRSREIEMPLPDAVEFRGQLIRQTTVSFRPDVLMVDHSPAGLCGEALPALEELGRTRPAALRILGMRDVIDEPEAVRAAWKRDGIIDVLRRCYDRILVYGQREVFDPIDAYEMPPDLARKVEFVGYVGRNGARTDPGETRRRFAPRTGRLVAVTVGGGGDGAPLIRSFLKGYMGLGASAPFEVVIVTGPLMSPRKRTGLTGRAEGIDGVTMIDYCDDIPGLYNAADGVVSMGGYNSTCELAYSGARALIVPRVFPRKEQLVRARKLAARGAIRMLAPDDATPEALMRTTQAVLVGARPQRRWGLNLGGLDNISRALDRLLAEPRTRVVAARGVVQPPRRPFRAMGALIAGATA